MLAFGAVGKVIRVAEGVSLFATASEGGLYGAIIAEAYDTNKFAGVAFGFAGGGVGHCVGGVFSKIAKPMPLTDRALMPNAVYHTGFHPMGELFVVDKSLTAKTLERLKNSTSHLKPKEIKSLEGRISNWLGEGTKLIRNEAGDLVFISKDKLGLIFTEQIHIKILTLM